MASAEGPVGAGSRELRQRDRTIGAVTALLLLIGMPVGWLGDNTSTGDVIGMIVLIVVMLAAIAFVILRVVPREEAIAGRPARTALILGILAAVSVVVFWTGLPFPLGAGAIALGIVGQEAAGPGEPKGRAVAAIVLGSVAVALAFVALLVG
jgi:hypothetical protein